MFKQKNNLVKDKKGCFTKDKKDVVDVNMLYHNKKRWNISRIVIWFKEKYFPTRTVIANIELFNGMHHTLLVIESSGGFTFRSGKYLFDNESKYYNIQSCTYCYDFHEGFCLPIKRIIPINKIKKVIESAGLTEVEYATNPLTLERFIIAKIAEGVMKGQAIDEAIKRITLMMIIILIAVIGHLLLFMFKTGMLSNVNIPGF